MSHSHFCLLTSLPFPLGCCSLLMWCSTSSLQAVRDSFPADTINLWSGNSFNAWTRYGSLEHLWGFHRGGGFRETFLFPLTIATGTCFKHESSDETELPALAPEAVLLPLLLTCAGRGLTRSRHWNIIEVRHPIAGTMLYEGVWSLARAAYADLACYYSRIMLDANSLLLF